MPQNIELSIPIDPRNLPPGTAAQDPGFSPTSGVNRYSEELSSRGLVGNALGLTVLRQVATTYKGLISDFTGSGVLEDDVNKTLTYLRYGATLVQYGPVAGGLLVGAEIGLEQVKEQRELKNRNIDAGYQRSLNENRLRGNR